MKTKKIRKIPKPSYLVLKQVTNKMLSTEFEMSASGEGEAFPKAAVQSFHEKPMPTHEKNPVQRPTIIQQPRI